VKNAKLSKDMEKSDVSATIQNINKFKDNLPFD
jgi:hypothetical protein